jgi:hypothetical protein
MSRELAVVACSVDAGLRIFHPVEFRDGGTVFQVSPYDEWVRGVSGFPLPERLMAIELMFTAAAVLGPGRFARVELEKVAL